MVSDKIFAPASPYSVVKKIIHAYLSPQDKRFDLDEIAKRSGQARDTITRNNRFLVSMGIITPGIKKGLSPIGKQLALAIDHNDQDNIRKIWRKIIVPVPSFESVFQRLKIEKKTDQEQLTMIMLSSLELKQNQRTTAGVRCIIKIFEEADILRKQDGKYELNPSALMASEENEREKTSDPPSSTPGEPPTSRLSPPEPARDEPVYPEVHIDIQIHISADAKPEQIDQVFLSMAKHLYN